MARSIQSAIQSFCRQKKTSFVLYIGHQAKAKLVDFFPLSLSPLHLHPPYVFGESHILVWSGRVYYVEYQVRLQDTVGRLSITECLKLLIIGLLVHGASRRSQYTHLD